MKNRMLWSGAAIFGAIIILSLIFTGCGVREPGKSGETTLVLISSPTVIPPTPVATAQPAVPVTGSTKIPIVESQSDTAKGENSILKMDDGSMIILMPDAQAKVVSQPPQGSATGKFEIELTSGQILVIPAKSNGLVFTVKDASGSFARLQSGCSMAVSADPGTSNFGMMCLGGECEMGENENAVIKVKANEAWSYSGGKAEGPNAIDPTALEQLFKGNLPQCAMLIPVTGQDTPQPNVAATSACNTFKAQFPGTPCP